MCRLGETRGSAEMSGEAMTEPAFEVMRPEGRGTLDAALITSSRSIRRRTLLSLSANAGAWKAARSALMTRGERESESEKDGDNIEK